MDQLARHLKKLRVEQGLTQRDLAAPKYTAAYVSSIEAGRRRPTKQAIAHFAKRLAVSEEELFSGRSPAERAQLLGEIAMTRKLLASSSPDSVDEARERLERLLARAKGGGYVDVQAKALLGLGLCAETVNDLARALNYYDEAFEVLRTESPIGRVDAIAARARVLQTQGEIAYAAFLLQQALAELRDADLEDPASLLRLHASLVAVFYDAGLENQAHESAEIALAFANQVDDPDKVANMYLNVGIMLAQQGHWRDAEQKLAEAEWWFNEIGFETDLARVRLVRGINLRNRGRFDEGRVHLEAAVQTFAFAGNALREARAAVALGVLERMAGRNDEALFVLKRALKLAGEDKGVAGIAQRELALCHAERDRGLAVKELRKAIKLLEGAGLAKDLATCYRALGDLLSQDKELEPACDAYRRAAELLQGAA